MLKHLSKMDRKQTIGMIHVSTIIPAVSLWKSLAKGRGFHRGQSLIPGRLLWPRSFAVLLSKKHDCRVLIVSLEACIETDDVSQRDTSQFRRYRTSSNNEFEYC
jgi:hypothetical protein